MSSKKLKRGDKCRERIRDANGHPSRMRSGTVFGMTNDEKMVGVLLDDGVAGYWRPEDLCMPERRAK